MRREENKRDVIKKGNVAKNVIIIKIQIEEERRNEQELQEFTRRHYKHFTSNERLLAHARVSNTTQP